jgi:ankyrin repeat protein
MRKGIKLLLAGLFLLFSASLTMGKTTESELLVAVKKGNLKKVVKLVEKGADINKGSLHFSPLERAAYDGNLEIVKFLVSKNAQDPKEAFRNALRKNHIAVAKYFVEQGLIDVNKAGSFFAIVFLNKKITFEQQLQIVKEVTGDKLHSPHILTFVQPENYQRIIKDFDINISDKVDDLGRTILHIAAIRNDVELTKYLLENGFNVNTLDNNNQTALFYCITSIGPEIIWEKPIIENENTAKINYIGGIPYYNNLREIRTRQAAVGSMLLDAGINVNQQNRDGWTVLHFAYASYNKGPKKTLTENGAKPTLKTKFGRTPDDLEKIVN